MLWLFWDFQTNKKLQFNEKMNKLHKNRSAITSPGLWSPSENPIDLLAVIWTKILSLTEKQVFWINNRILYKKRSF